MKIYQTAHYQVNEAAIERVAEAIDKFVDYVTTHEPGTLFYAAWQADDDPSKFVHLFTFANEEAHRAHGQSDAVHEFEAVYRPELVGGPVQFTDYCFVAANRLD